MNHTSEAVDTLCGTSTSARIPTPCLTGQWSCVPFATKTSQDSLRLWPTRGHDVIGGTKSLASAADSVRAACAMLFSGGAGARLRLWNGTIEAALDTAVFGPYSTHRMLNWPSLWNERAGISDTLRKRLRRRSTWRFATSRLIPLLVPCTPTITRASGY